ncbi:MAG: amidohydrolase family protein [Bacteroidales bacterium]|nr:amidohydrolase family protein [Bacteroidales bacterium]
MKIIDCEFHYYLPELMEYLSTREETPRYIPEEKVFVPRDNVYANFAGVTNTYSIIDELMNFGDERVAEMDRNGVSIGVMASSAALEELPREESVYFARKSNDAVAELVKRYPGRFVGSAVLPTPYVDEAIKELERCVKELGFKYWHTHSNYKTEHLYEEKYLPLLAKAEELGCAFYVHPHTPDDADFKDFGYVYAAPGLGFGVDTIKTSLRLILNGTFDKFPKLRMILGHLGEYFPFIMDRIDNRFSWIKEPVIKMQHPVSYYFKNKNVVVTTSGQMSTAAFECCKNVLGIDSIMFGSDYPYENMKDMVGFYESLNLNDEEKEKLFHLNAEKYLLQ